MTSPETVAYISLGSNIAPEENLAAAVKLLRQSCRVLAVSSAYITAPQGYTDQPDFYNMAVKVETVLTPAEFKLQVLDRIEAQLKRVRDPHNKNAPRTIDLDLSLWGDLSLDYGERPWHVPDKDIVRFAHVAVPLAEIAPDFVHPETGDTLLQIAARLGVSGFRRIALSLD